jgi:hypothetical protein
MLIRFAKRVSHWEEPNLPPEEFQRGEFRDDDGNPDLRVSVYEFDDAALAIQARAEFCSSLNLGLERALGVDASNTDFNHTQTPGIGLFQFLRSTHREIVLPDDAALSRFIGTLRSELESRSVKISKAELKRYIQTKFAAGDKEWNDAADRDGAKSWHGDIKSKAMDAARSEPGSK